jgi:hypothetical protein
MEDGLMSTSVWWYRLISSIVIVTAAVGFVLEWIAGKVG